MTLSWLKLVKLLHYVLIYFRGKYGFEPTSKKEHWVLEEREKEAVGFGRKKKKEFYQESILSFY